MHTQLNCGFWSNRTFLKLYRAHVVSLLGIRGRELLAANSNKEERAHIYAAHFALSHAGWGITYPLAGVLTSRLGFAHADWIFAGLVMAVAIPYWILHLRRRGF